MTTIDLREIEHRFGDTVVLDPVSLTIASGSAVGVIGPSGCGKSTLLRLVAGLLTPTSGSIRADGAPIMGPGPERGVVFQQNALFPWLTVAQNIGFGLDQQGIAKPEARRRVVEWIGAVGLDAFADQRPGALSGGMAQRVALARALAPEPGALLLDEPFGALDRITRGQMQELLVSVWQRTRATLLLITHDVEEALAVCDRVIVMSPRPGHVLADIEVNLPRPRDLASRTSHDFVALRRRIEGVLHTAMATEA
jgi:ABC-type nitrate/sulfonate/bicarbonate transport system ATPase subunit